MGRQGFCRYWWRIFSNGAKVMYCKTDGGNLEPVAGSPIFYDKRK